MSDKNLYILIKQGGHNIDFSEIFPKKALTQSRKLGVTVTEKYSVEYFIKLQRVKNNLTIHYKNILWILLNMYL